MAADRTSDPANAPAGEGARPNALAVTCKDLSADKPLTIDLPRSSIGVNQKASKSRICKVAK